MTTHGDAIRFRLVNHAAFHRAARFVSAIDASPVGTLDFVVGASGAGKSELSRVLGPMIYGNAVAETVKPWIRVEAKNPDAGFFSSKYMMAKILRELSDPFRGDHGFADELPSDLAKLIQSTSLGARGPTETDMHTAASRLSRALKCRLVIIDEGNLISLTNKARPPESYIESFRTLSHDMGVRIVFLGTLRLLGVIGYSAQIDRVSNVTLLDRFRCDTDAGLSEYLSFLDSVEVDTGVAEGFLSERADELYNATYGIPGQLRDLLDTARRRAFADESAELAWAHVDGAMPHQAIRNRMRVESDFVQKVCDGNELDNADIALLRSLRLR